MTTYAFSYAEENLLDTLVAKLQKLLVQFGQRCTHLAHEVASASWRLAEWYADVRRSHTEVAILIDQFLTWAANLPGLPGKIMKVVNDLHRALISAFGLGLTD
ncbi:hypothetical protein ACQBAU_04600 [Propionibacteriaceae bacterium Y2011]